MFENVDGRTDGRRTTDAGVTGILIAHLGAFGSGELKTRSKVKVIVTQKWYTTYHHPKMHPYTKLGIPNSKNIEDLHLT